VIYRAWLDGTIERVDPGVTTPFAAVTTFDADATGGPFEAMTFAELRQRVDEMLAPPGRPYAVRIDGVFQLMVIRSVPQQSRPYVPLTEALKGQAVRELHNVRGTLVGFVMPGYLKHLNVVGHHYHFISEDRQVGGHVLDLVTEGVTITVDDCRSLNVLLPKDAPSAPVGAFR
jgi:acetolactate decarboxylase